MLILSLTLYVHFVSYLVYSLTLLNLPLAHIHAQWRHKDNTKKEAHKAVHTFVPQNQFAYGGKIGYK